MVKKHVPRCVQAAKMRDAGIDHEEIAKLFGWTKRTALVNISRGRNWQDFLSVNGDGKWERYHYSRTERRRRKIPGQIAALRREAERLGLKLSK